MEAFVDINPKDAKDLGIKYYYYMYIDADQRDH